MLSPGDQVFLDNDHDPAHRWTVASVERKGKTNWYTFEGWSDPFEEIPASRITAHWCES